MHLSKMKVYLGIHRNLTDICLHKILKKSIYTNHSVNIVQNHFYTVKDIRKQKLAINTTSKMYSLYAYIATVKIFADVLQLQSQ